MNTAFLIIAAACTILLMESLAIGFVGWLLKPKNTKRMTVIPLAGRCEDVEQCLRWELYKHETDVFEQDDVLLIVDCGICSEAVEIAKRLCADRRNCRFCAAAELKGIVGDDAVYKGIELVLY